MRTHKTVLRGGVVVLAALCGVQGCMRDELEVGRNADDAGAPDVGGSAGKTSSGGSGAAGNAEGGAGADGGTERGGSSGRGGTAAVGGGAAGGAGGSTGGAGAGIGGDAGAVGCALDASAEVLSLEDYCSRASCPALSDLQHTGRSPCASVAGVGVSFPTQTTGCGRIVVDRPGASETKYVYDAASEELVGVYARGDAGGASCAGDVSGVDSCADASSCQFCTPGVSTPPDVQACPRAVPFDFDPACICEALVDGEFSCRLSTADAAARIPPEPANCDNDLDYVTRADCGHILVYRWSEGMENDYELELDTGALRYLSAFGYVGPICGIYGSDYQFGSIVAGTRLADSCDAQCAVCSTGDYTRPTDGLPACEPCSDRTQFETNTETLADYCEFHHCPASLEAAKAELAAQCSGDRSSSNDVVVTTGCGTIGLVHDMGEGVEAYYFDAQTNALAGALEGNDTPGGNCEAFSYVGGSVPTDPCADANTCSLCASGESDGAGAAGSAGEALPPACEQ